MMSEQMIYTSCRRGIESSENGYKIYSYSKDIDKDLLSDLIRIGSYSLKSTGLPTMIEEKDREKYPLAFRYITVNGHHAITRSRFLGVDWSGTRFGSNYLAHSITIEDQSCYPIEYYGSNTFEKNVDLSLFSSNDEVKHLNKIDLEHNPVDFESIRSFVEERGTEAVKACFSCLMKGDNFIIKDTQRNIPKWIAACTMMLPIKMAIEIPYSSFDDHGWESNYPGIVGIWSSDNVFQYKQCEINNDDLVNEYIDEALTNTSIRDGFIDFVNEKCGDVRITDLPSLLKQYYYFVLGKDYLEDVVCEVERGYDVHPDVVCRCIFDLLDNDDRIKENIETIEQWLLPQIIDDSIREKVDNSIILKDSSWVEAQKQSITKDEYNKYKDRVLDSIKKGKSIEVNSIETVIVLSNWIKIENNELKEKTLDYLNEHEYDVEQLIIRMVDSKKKFSMLKVDNPYTKKVALLNNMIDGDDSLDEIINHENQYSDDIIEVVYRSIINKEQSSTNSPFRNPLFGCSSHRTIYRKVVLDAIDTSGMSNELIGHIAEYFKKSKDKDQGTNDIRAVLEKINRVMEEDVKQPIHIDPNFDNALVFKKEIDSSLGNYVDKELLKNFHYLTLNHVYSQIMKKMIDYHISSPIDVKEDLIKIFYKKIISLILDDDIPNSGEYIDYLETMSKKKSILYDVICEALTNQDKHKKHKNYSNVATSFLERLISDRHKKSKCAEVSVDGRAHLAKSNNEKTNNGDVDPRLYLEQLIKEDQFVEVIKHYYKKKSKSGEVDRLSNYLQIKKRLVSIEITIKKE